MDKFIKNLLSVNLLYSVLIILFAVVFWVVTKNIARRYLGKKKVQGKIETVIRVILNILKYLVLLITITTVLQINGINVSSLLAGLGIASIIIGLALQDLLKDFIMGINILADEYFVIGDVVRYKGVEGVVIALSFKCTKIKDIDNSSILTVCNSNISEITRVSGEFDVDIPLSYEDSKKSIDGIIKVICDSVKEEEDVKDCEYIGIEGFNASSLSYRIRVFCNPIKIPKLRRRVQCIVWDKLGESSLTIPYDQLDIHKK